MSPTPESAGRDSIPDAEPEQKAPGRPPQLILMPLTGPPIPDMTARIAESLKRHEAELAAAEKLVAQARSGSVPTLPERTVEPLPPPAPGEYRIEIDWRGESAYFVEHDRRVWLECIYWGGPHGSVSHIHGVWEYADGRRERLTAEERAHVLQRVIEYARTHHDIKLEIERG